MRRGLQPAARGRPQVWQCCLAGSARRACANLAVCPEILMSRCRRLDSTSMDDSSVMEFCLGGARISGKQMTCGAVIDCVSDI